MKKITLMAATAALGIGLSTTVFAGGSVAKSTDSKTAQQTYAMPKPFPCDKNSKHACLVTKEGAKLCGCFNKVPPSSKPVSPNSGTKQ